MLGHPVARLRACKRLLDQEAAGTLAETLQVKRATATASNAVVLRDEMTARLARLRRRPRPRH